MLSVCLRTDDPLTFLSLRSLLVWNSSKFTPEGAAGTQRGSLFWPGSLAHCKFQLLQHCWLDSVEPRSAKSLWQSKLRKKGHSDTLKRINRLFCWENAHGIAPGFDFSRLSLRLFYFVLKKIWGSAANFCSQGWFLPNPVTMEDVSF